MIPAKTQQSKTNKGECKVAAIMATFLKTPEPNITLITTKMAERRPREADNFCKMLSDFMN
jgi:hypothetical protein